MLRKKRTEVDVSCCIEVVREGRAIDVDVDGTYVPFQRAGDGYEAEPAEVVVLSTNGPDGKHVKLSAKEMDEAEEGLFDDAADQVVLEEDEDDEGEGEIDFDE